MEEVQRNKRRRVYSIEPNAVVYTSFSLKYMFYLLPALLKATNLSCSDGRKEEMVKKKVRFEVDMALVLSADGFRWSHALKHKLEQGTNTTRHYRSTVTGKHNRHFGSIEDLDQFLQTPRIPRYPIPIMANRPKRVQRPICGTIKTFPDDQELGCHVRILRRILPGGNEMGMCELLSEVESYLICLQLQVNILRSLVETP